MLSFRGTLSSKNMLTDLKMSQVALPDLTLARRPYKVRGGGGGPMHVFPPPTLWDTKETLSLKKVALKLRSVILILYPLRPPSQPSPRQVRRTGQNSSSQGSDGDSLGGGAVDGGGASPGAQLTPPMDPSPGLGVGLGSGVGRGSQSQRASQARGGGRARPLRPGSASLAVNYEGGAGEDEEVGLGTGFGLGAIRNGGGQEAAQPLAEELEELRGSVPNICRQCLASLPGEGPVRVWGSTMSQSVSGLEP